MEVGIARILARALPAGSTGLYSRSIASGVRPAEIFGLDRLCAVVAAGSAAAAIEQLRVAKNTAKARVVELRLDFLAGRAQIDALLSWLARQPRKPILIATCRRLPAGGRFKGSIEAEIAILVADKFQHCGLGSELVRRLMQVGHDEKLERIIMTILPENTAMRGLASHFGFEAVKNNDLSEIRIALKL